MNRFNKLYIGLLLGVLAPLLFGFLFLNVLSERNGVSIIAAFNSILQNSQFFFKLFIVSISPNLFGLFIFYKLEFWRICSGLISTTFLYFIIAIIQL